MKIQTNTAANYALGYTRTNAAATERSIQKLSSGFRINRASDDAAGLAIANKLRADGRSLGQAQKNAAQASAMLQVMDGGAQTISGIMDRMKELATQANSDNVGTERGKLQGEFNALRNEIDRIAQTTKYQGTGLINGTFGVKVDRAASGILGGATNVTDVTLSGAKAEGVGGSSYTFSDTAGDITLTYDDGAGNTTVQTVQNATANSTVTFDKLGVTIQLGAGYVGGEADGDLETTGSGGNFMVSSSGQYDTLDRISVASVDLTVTGLALGGFDLSLAPDVANGAKDTLIAIDAAINTLNTALGNIGAAQSRLDVAGANVATMYQNTLAAESTVRDADMAYEMTQFTKNNILQQAAQSMLSQANQNPQGILQLLRG